MEQKISALSSLLRAELSGLGQAGAAAARNQMAISPLLFGGMVVDANLKAVVRPEIQIEGEVDTPFELLIQQISALSAETENQLAIAAGEGDSSQGVADIVAGAVAQLWEILGSFDAENNTTLVQDYSENLVRGEVENEGMVLARVTLQPLDGFVSQDGGVIRPEQGGKTNPAQPGLPLNVVEQTGLSGFQVLKPAAKESPLNNGVVQVATSVPAPVSLGINTVQPAVAQVLPGANTAQPIVAQEPHLANVVQATVAPLAAQARELLGAAGHQTAASDGVQPGVLKITQLAGPAAQGGKLTVFEQILTALKQPAPANAGGSQQAILAVATPAAPLGRGDFALPQNMQQFAAALSNSEQVPNSGAVAQPGLAVATGEKSAKLALAGIIAGIDINSRAKDLLLASAKATVFRAESLTGVAETGNMLANARVEAVLPGPLVKPEQASGSFSKSIASQIQGEILNPGRTRIELAPRGLGNIVIDLQPKDTGGLQVLLRVENPVVLNALRMDRETLLTVLANADVSLEDISLDFQGFGESEFAQDDESQGSLQVSGTLDEAEAPPEMGRTLSRGGTARAGQLDFFT